MTVASCADTATMPPNGKALIGGGVPGRAHRAGSAIDPEGQVPGTCLALPWSGRLSEGQALQGLDQVAPEFVEVARVGIPGQPRIG